MSSFIGAQQKFAVEINDVVKVIETAILAGNIVGFEEYKRLVGKRDGLIQALEIHRHLAAQMENYDDDRTNR